GLRAQGCLEREALEAAVEIPQPAQLAAHALEVSRRYRCRGGALAIHSRPVYLYRPRSCTNAASSRSGSALRPSGARASTAKPSSSAARVRAPSTPRSLTKVTFPTSLPVSLPVSS